MDTFMKIMETVFYPMMAYMDWTFDNDVNPIVATLGLIGIGAGYVGVAATPFMIKAHFNNKAMERSFNALDKGPSTAFNVAADENSYTQFQLQAIKSARKMAGKLGNGVSYSSESACSKKHKDYTRNQYTVMQPMQVGKVTTMIPRTVVEYNPHVVGYQVANDNPEIAVPLYSSLEKGRGLRSDGVLVALPEL